MGDKKDEAADLISLDTNISLPITITNNNNNNNNNLSLNNNNNNNNNNNSKPSTPLQIDSLLSTSSTPASSSTLLPSTTPPPPSQKININTNSNNNQNQHHIQFEVSDKEPFQIADEEEEAKDKAFWNNNFEDDDIDDDASDPDGPELLALSPSVALHEEHMFTFRAVSVGCLLGCIISASNMYLGLTVGWHFGGSLFGSIVGFAILKPLSRVLPKWFGGGYFGPKENCTVQSAASAAGGLSVGFTSAIPALYRLGLMGKSVREDVSALILWALSAAYFGLFFAIPLRRYFILKQKLVFPSPTVSAKTIQSLHDSSDGEHSGRAKARVLMIAFLVAFAIKCATWWLPIIQEWHVLYYIGVATGGKALMVADVIWRWRFQMGGAFIGAGMLVGTNTATSFFAGSILSWAVVGPALFATGWVATSFGFPASLDPNHPLSAEEFEKQVTAQYWILWPGVTLMITTSFAELGARGPSLWRGIKGGVIEAYDSIVASIASMRGKPYLPPHHSANLYNNNKKNKRRSLYDDDVELLKVTRGHAHVMVEEPGAMTPEKSGTPETAAATSSTTRVSFEDPLESTDPVLRKSLEEGLRDIKKRVLSNRRKSVEIALPPPPIGAEDEEEEEDPAGPDEQVPFLWWSLGLLASAAFTVIVLYVFFKVPPGQGFLAIVMGFLLAFVGIQASGETDINPTGSIGKTSQFVFSAIRTDNISQMLRTNLICGQVASACAAQTVDMVGDLKTAHLLRATPKSQFLAQAVGSLVAVFISVGLFTLFGIAYPCFLTGSHNSVATNATAIIYSNSTTSNLTLSARSLSETVVPTSCPFAAPAVASWTAVSVALTSGISRTIPKSAAWASLATLVLGVLYTTIKYTVVPARHRPYMPNLNALGIAMVNPQPFIGVAMGIGALANTIWRRSSPHQWEKYAFAVASGIIAGEGIAGIVEALYALGGLRRERMAVWWGIPNATEISEVYGWTLGA